MLIKKKYRQVMTILQLFSGFDKDIKGEAVKFPDSEKILTSVKQSILHH